MPAIDLKVKYGQSLKTHEAINRAVRAELIGGDHCLTSLACLSEMRRKFLERGFNTLDVEIALKHVTILADGMKSEIRRRYEIGQ
jgi:hypothetical protein